MSDVFRTPNGNAILLTPRSGSHSLALTAMQAFWPNITVQTEGHPAWYFGNQENWLGDNANIAHNPIERFRSMVYNI